jgi:hypothetical protein
MSAISPRVTSIVTLTPNPAIDVSTTVDRVEPDRKLRWDEPRRDPGGGGLNVARAITRLGGAVLECGRRVAPPAACPRWRRPAAR